MICHYCRSVNADDDHRCRRCGRRAISDAVEAPPEHARRAIQAVGANALAAAQATLEMERPAALKPQKTTEAPAPQPKIHDSQPPLFSDELTAAKVIPFERAQKRDAASQKAAAKVPEPVALPETAELYASRPAKGGAPAKGKTAANAQSTLDFLPPVSHQAKLLKTTVEATIRCDCTAATPVHRSTAAALDAGFIVGGFSLFLVIVRVFGGPLPWNRMTIPAFAGAFALIALFYGLIWVLADTETPGMRWTDLKLVTFNGFPLERKARALRMLGCFLSFCSGMIGILWALVDEEGLTWHDHMSKTFPTLRDTGSHLVRE